MEELLSNVDLFGIIGWVIGIIGVAFISALWNVVKAGKHLFEVREKAEQDNKWTEEELRAYVKASINYWDEMRSLGKTIWKGIKKLFTKK